MGRPALIEKHAASLAVIKMRQELGWTQAKLAEAMDVALPTVGRWESFGIPSEVALRRLADFAMERGLEAEGGLRDALVGYYGDVDMAVGNPHSDMAMRIDAIFEKLCEIADLLKEKSCH